MVDNLPVRTHKHKGLTIEGYSRAAVQSYWRIPEMKIGFDLGGSPWSFIGTPTIFVTHAHLDHMAALPAYVARRRMMKMEPPTIYLPEEALEATQLLLRVWQKLDRGRMNCTLIPVKAGDQFELSREHLVTTFATKHTVPSLGYMIWERRKKLRMEYIGLTQDQIRDIRLSGKEVSIEVRSPVVCYTGDTAPAGLDNCPDLFNSQILITEVTFFRPEHRKEKIHKFGHMHLDDVIERADKFKNELVIFSHFSTRYNERQFEKAINQRLPATLKDRVVAWL